MNSQTNDGGIRKVRVATYTRVSTQEQATEGTSLDFQDNQLNDYCQLQGWTIINSYVDPGYSGKDGNRPGLERLLSDAKIGLFDKVVICRLDRLARNLHLLLNIEQELRAREAFLTSIKESVDTSTATGKMVFQMFGMIAEWERDSIVERTRNGRLQRYRAGQWAGGPVPYGYLHNKATRKLEIDETEARIVRRMYQEYANGKSLHGIGEGLNGDKVPARGKNSCGWKQTAVRQVLINQMYKGTQIVNRHAHISDINKIDLTKAILIPVPPIVNEQIWQVAGGKKSLAYRLTFQSQAHTLTDSEVNSVQQQILDRLNSELGASLRG